MARRVRWTRRPDGVLTRPGRCRAYVRRISRSEFWWTVEHDRVPGVVSQAKAPLRSESIAKRAATAAANRCAKARVLRAR